MNARDARAVPIDGTVDRNVYSRGTTVNIRKKIAAAAATAGLAGACLLSGTGSAAAAGNGQQLLFQDHQGKVYSVLVSGQDQNGNRVSHCFQTSQYNNYLSGWWWKGWIYYEAYVGSHCQGDQVAASNGMLMWTVNVPENQPGSDWYVIGDLDRIRP